MNYSKIVHGTFLSRPNRFIAKVEIDGKEETCHIKNTGRCRELLIPGVSVILEDCRSPNRKTGFDLIQVYKGKRLINMDSMAPNKAVGEWLKEGKYFKSLTLIKPETTFGSSRFDFYMESISEKFFLEVKGVTLEHENRVFFPDAPTDRGVRHILELIKAKEEGYRAVAMFVIQMENVLSFSPNDSTHPEFGEALRKASEAGVEILAYDCHVAPGEMTIGKPVKILL